MGHRRLSAGEIKQKLLDMLGNRLLDKRGAKKVELKVRVTAETISSMNGLQDRLNTDDPAVVFKHALAVLEVVLDQLEDRRIIVARDRSGERRDVVMQMAEPTEDAS